MILAAAPISQLHAFWRILLRLWIQFYCHLVIHFACRVTDGLRNHVSSTWRWWKFRQWNGMLQLHVMLDVSLQSTTSPLPATLPISHLTTSALSSYPCRAFTRTDALSTAKFHVLDCECYHRLSRVPSCRGWLPEKRAWLDSRLLPFTCVPKSIAET